MTIQEAIDKIDTVLNSTVYNDESLEYEISSYDFEWLEIAKSALEKQIPKKPITEMVNRGISVSGEYDIDFDYLCPNCNTVVGDYEIDDVFCKFCPNCGQAIALGEVKK